MGLSGVLLVGGSLVVHGPSWLSWVGLVITFAAMVASFWVGGLRDDLITQSYVVMGRLEASQAVFRSTLDAVDVIVFLLDARDRITDVQYPTHSPLLWPSEWFVGKHPKELGMGQSVDDCFHSLLPRLHRSPAEEVVRSRFELTFSHGLRKYSVVARAMRSATGDYQGCIVASTDQTDQLDQAQALMESEAKFRALYEASADAILLMNGEDFLDCNYSALIMFGYVSLDELRSLKTGALTADYLIDGRPSKEVVLEHARLALDRGVHSFEWIQVRKDGTTFQSEVLMTRVVLADQAILETVVRDISVRKEGEVALLASQERFRILFETSPTGFALNGMDGQFLEANAAFLDILGYSMEELSQLSSSEVSPKQSDKEREVMLRQMVEDRAYGPYETDYIRKDGTLVPVHLKGVVVTDSQGVDRIWSVVENITQRKQWEQELRIREERLQALIRLAPVGIFEVDLAGKCVFVNAECSRLAGLASELDWDHDWIQSVHPEDQKLLRPRWEAFLEGRGSFHLEFRFLKPGGIESWVEGRANSIWDSEGHVTGYLGTVLDVSLRKDAEQDMAHLTSILETTTDFIATFDPEGYIRYLNPAARKLLGYTENQDLTNFSLSGLIPPSATDKVLNEAIPSAFMFQSWKGDTAIITAEGEEIPVSQIITAHKDRRGKVIYYSTSLRDITDRTLIEGELRHHRDHLQEMVAEQTEHLSSAKEEAERANRSKSTFLANMSHELRTPVHAIISFSDLGAEKTRQGTASPEKLLRYFENVHTAAKRLLLLLNDLLDLSKLEAGRMIYQMGRHNLLAVIQEAQNELKPLLDEKQMTLSIHSEIEDPQAWFDPLRLGQVVRNLLGNAIKFNPRGQPLRITLKQAQISGGRRQSDASQVPAMEFTLQDSGPGIPVAELESIFDPFVQSSKTQSGAGGTGLGLPICREVLAAHQGRIWADNGPEGGAVFTFLMPVLPSGGLP